MKNLILLGIALFLMVAAGVCFAKDIPAKLLTANTAPDYKKNSSNIVVNEKKATQNTAASETGSDTTVAEEAKINSNSIIIDHTCIKLDQVPVEWIEKARKELHIAYGHTSHGSQIISGMLALTDFKKGPYIYKKDLSGGSLDLRDNPFRASRIDLGYPDNKTWAQDTRKYLDANKDINVVMWAWCGQLSKASKSYVNNYLKLMQDLEKDYPHVKFIYMTGHLDGTGENKTLAVNNNIIREFCAANGKILYDFADIESYNPDGEYFGDKYANDACGYDSNGDRKIDSNWAIEWQDSHVEGKDWFMCASAHSQPINANMKAYAAWWLMARLAGWDGTPSAESE